MVMDIKTSYEDIKVLGYAWHEPHQYELSKVGFDYYLHRQLPLSGHGDWNLKKRPLPSNVLEINSVETNMFDLQILHLDECCTPNKPKYLSPYWDLMYLTHKAYDIPCITINHGVPRDEANKLEMQERVGDDLVVCNSEQSMKDWGFPNSVALIHGLSPEEFPLGTCDNKKVLCSVGKGAMTNSPHYYGKELFDEITKEVPVDVFKATAESFIKYQERISDYSIYLNTTLTSPMPRARTEAMMSGVVIISTPYYDWDKYIIDGVNGFLFTTAEEAIKKIRWCLDNPEEARLIGLQGRETAIKEFNIERYTREWKQLIKRKLRQSGSQ